MENELAELHETMNEPDFWNDLERSTKVSQRVKVLEDKLSLFKKLNERAADIDTMMELAEEEGDESMVAEAGMS